MSPFVRTLSAATVGLLAMPVYAHHPTGGEIPDTVLYGVLSGIGHPMIDPTHLAFILGVGLLFAIQKGSFANRVLLFLAATWIGAFGHLSGLDIPGVEAIMALGIIAAGIMLAWRRLAILPGVLVLAGGAGVLHGFAYAEAIVGARTGPLIGYFFGFTLIQGAVLVGTIVATRALVSRHAPGLMRRVELACGAALAGLGVLLLMS